MAESDRNEARELVASFVRAGSATTIGYWDDLPELEVVAKAQGEFAREIALAALEKLVALEYELIQIEASEPRYHSLPAHALALKLDFLLIRLLKLSFQKKAPLTSADLTKFLAWMNAPRATARNLELMTCGLVLKAIEKLAAKAELAEELQGGLRELAAKLNRHPSREANPFRARAEKLVGAEPALDLTRGEAWSDAALRFLAAAEPETRKHWVRLLAHCQVAGSGGPTGKWTKEARQLLAAIGRASFNGRVAEWLSLFEAPRTGPAPRPYADQRFHVSGSHQDILKGLVQCAAHCEGAAFEKPLTSAALAAYTKLPMVGPRALKVGNACVWSLGQLGGDAALAALAVLRVRVKARAGQKAVEDALTEISERTGVRRDDLDELGVPAYGFDDVGVRREQLGNFVAELGFSSRGKAELRFSSEGKSYKSTPAAVKTEFKEQLVELKEVLEDAETMLGAQRRRLDGFFTARRRWPLALFRERYLDHHLLGILARKLIWTLHEGESATPVIWHGGVLVDSDGHAVHLPAAAEISPWHPVEATIEAVMAWRGFLERHAIEQPFKQAHREVYLLTDAERATHNYSNRFASHIVKQAQFNALCRDRGWNTSARLNVDADLAPPARELPAWDLRAEFWVGSIGEETNDVGSYLYLATDQVRFYRRDAAKNETHASGLAYASRGEDDAVNHPLPLESIPPLVLSEILRDIDLFVGVSSIGNDPTWTDRGVEVEHRDYWERFSFGELGELAKTRRVLLETLLPRLKISAQCQLTDRFLVVRGKLTSYKIHLGSSNILMEPSDQYLCIVKAPGDSRSEPIFLPFDGDSRLTAILSKAMLLAQDDQIDDPSISSQIQRALA